MALRTGNNKGEGEKEGGRGGKKRRTRRNYRSFTFQLTLKIPNKNSIVKNDKKKMVTGGKFLGFRDFILGVPVYSAVDGGGIEIKQGGECNGSLIDRRWNFRDKKPKLSQCKLRYIPPSRFDDFLSPVFQ